MIASAAFEFENESIHVTISMGVAELAPEGMRGLLLQAMYGTRRASFLWGEEAAGTLTHSKNWTRTGSCGQVFYNTEADAVCAVHGDDFFAVADSAGLDALERIIGGRLEVKEMVRVGPG